MTEASRQAEPGAPAPAGARENEAEAFWRLAEDFRPYLKAVAAKLLGGQLGARVDASDVVQQGLLAAFEQFGQFRGQSAEQWQHWLVAIVRNQARNQAVYWTRDKRDRHRDRALADGSGSDFAVAASGSTPSRQLARREEVAHLMAAIERLPPDYREVLRLRNFENLPYAVVATHMNRSEAAVRQLWERAVRRLRDEWKEDG